MPWTIISAFVGIAFGAYMMHLWWLRRWNRAEFAMEHFRGLRNAATDRMTTEENDLIGAGIYGTAIGLHYAYEMLKNHVMHGQPMETIDDLGAPPGTPAPTVDQWHEHTKTEGVDP